MVSRNAVVRVNAENSLGETESHEIEGHADTCPICHFAAAPEFKGAYVIGCETNASLLEVAYRCPRNECRGVYLSIFTRRADRYGRYEGPFGFVRSEPSYPKSPELPDDIEKLSPRFADVYAQANAAEEYGLSEVAGPGYRKAFEILIKDYIIGVIAQEEGDREAVVGNHKLGQLIDQYFAKSKLAQVLHRTAWLGNDETHYARKWENQDLQDLHNLIRIALNMIENEMLAAAYIEDMQ